MVRLRQVVTVGSVSLVFLVLILLFVSYFFSADPPVDTRDEQPSTETSYNLGLENITTVDPLRVIPFDPDASLEPSAEVARDDRVYTPTSGESSIPLLMRVFKGPLAGYRVDTSNSGFPVFKVVERGRGDRYLIQTLPYSVNRVASGEFTRVAESHVFSNDDVLMMYEDSENESTIRSAFIPFIISDGDPIIQKFEDNIRVATNTRNKLFFIQTIDDGSVGVVVDVSNPSKTTVVWRSDFTSWIPRWGNRSRITLHTPVTDFMNGYVYRIDPNGVLPDDQFVSLSSGGSAFMDPTTERFVLFETKADNFAGKTRITNRTRSLSIDLPITLPEKCDSFNGVFICAVPRSIQPRTLSGYETLFPDSWYQGDINFDDIVMSINATTGEKKVLLSPTMSSIRLFSGGATFDIIHPRISNDGKYLFFVNKYDMSLWMLRLDTD